MKLTVRFGLDTMPDDTKDKIIAPKISKLRTPAWDISAERKFLLNTFILNFKLSMAFLNKNRQLTFNVIRKTEAALRSIAARLRASRDMLRTAGLNSHITLPR